MRVIDVGLLDEMNFEGIFSMSGIGGKAKAFSLCHERINASRYVACGSGYHVAKRSSCEFSLEAKRSMV